VFRRWQQSAEEQKVVVWSVVDILAKETKKNSEGKNEVFYYVKWAGKWDPTWEPKSNLMEDGKVAKMIQV